VVAFQFKSACGAAGQYHLRRQGTDGAEIRSEVEQGTHTSRPFGQDRRVAPLVSCRLLAAATLDKIEAINILLQRKHFSGFVLIAA
jgi:hypothetical protein